MLTVSKMLTPHYPYESDLAIVRHYGNALLIAFTCRDSSYRLAPSLYVFDIARRCFAALPFYAAESVALPLSAFTSQELLRVIGDIEITASDSYGSNEELFYLLCNGGVVRSAIYVVDADHGFRQYVVPGFVQFPALSSSIVWLPEDSKDILQCPGVGSGSISPDRQRQPRHYSAVNSCYGWAKRIDDRLYLWRESQLWYDDLHLNAPQGCLGSLRAIFMYDIAISPDQLTLAVAVNALNYEGEVRLICLTTWRLKATFKVLAHRMTFSPDGLTLVLVTYSVCNLCTVTILDME